MTRPMLILLTALIMSASPCLADWEEASGAYERGDYATAFREYRKLAETGDPSAEASLAYFYEKGLGTKQDYREAARLYHSAVSKDLLIANLYLGHLYAKGLGVQKDEAKAVGFFEVVARHGVVEAQEQLGTLLMRGPSSIRNPERAKYWLRQAADKNSAIAHELLRQLEQRK